MIYMSTGGFHEKTFLETSKLLNNGTIRGLELSAGRYSSSLNDDLSEVSKNFSIALHNYFPVPKEPFVFNLASCDKAIISKSLSHAKQAIDLTAEYGSKYYSFHAGYLLDPAASELGRSINKRRLIERATGLDNFVSNVVFLANYAESRGVELLIENNVLSQANYSQFNTNPLLMVDSEETEMVFDCVPNNVGLLIDVAHLKVSANTLGFDPINYLDRFNKITKAYHISDNNGLEDSNEVFTERSWFVQHIRKDLEYYSLEVYTSDVAVLESQYRLLSGVLR
ncbi:TIM barrel protein [Agarivorans albus]|uniref:Xylose isomerase domain protein TIM barrel n=1 Tax=Agarivorans albus MKT 106 TaxID=1331007 RepID=R9PN79_AGAAL|nr:TIM barrel protein [Agarivorans albus]GAD02760.1 xylose isomerase domain protein TIM barrel [Agarivorans albus MKT 106]